METSWAVERWTPSLVATSLFLAALAVGCIPSDTLRASVETATAARAPDVAGTDIVRATSEVAGLRLFVIPVAPTRSVDFAYARGDLSLGLRLAGFIVVDRGSDEHDLDVQVSWEKSSDASALRWVETISTEDEFIDRVESVSDFDCSGDGSQIGGCVAQKLEGARAAIVNKISASHRLGRFGRTKRESEKAVAQAEPPPAQTKSPAPPSSSPPSLPTHAFISGSPQPTALAIVVGVEQYHTLPNASGAAADARSFAQLARVSLGLTDAHIRLVVDSQATKGGIERLIEWARTTVQPGGRIYFFYSGHGAPDASTRASYLVPADGDPSYLKQTSLSMSDIMAQLGSSRAREVLALADSCFSGAGGRSVLPPGARPLVRVAELRPSAQVAFFSASSSSQIAGAAAGGGHGLFTSILLQALGTGQADTDGDGQISLQELSEWVTPRVHREAMRESREQTPTLVLGRGVGAKTFMVEWGVVAR